MRVWVWCIPILEDGLLEGVNVKVTAAADMINRLVVLTPISALQLLWGNATER